MGVKGSYLREKLGTKMSHENAIFTLGDREDTRVERYYSEAKWP